MRVLVMGAGGIGGFLGAALARSGCDVTFVTRGAHLEAMQDRGLEVRRHDGTFVLQPVKAVNSPAEAGTDFDLVALTVKCYDVEDAARALVPALGPQTSVLTLQNGVDAPAQVGRILGDERVLPGAAWFTVHVEMPGVLVQAGSMQSIILGERSGEVTPRVKAIAGTLEEAGYAVTVSQDPLRSLWEKFIPLAPVAALTAACQATLGEVRDVAEGTALIGPLTREVTAVGRASGVALPADHADKATAMIMGYSPKARASLAVDFERRRRVELEHLIGTVVRQGREFGVPTPCFDVLYATLKVRALTFGGITPSA